MAEYIYSNIQPGKLLHIINRFDAIQNGRKDIIPSHNFLQMATITLGQNQSFKPHRHRWNKIKDISRIAQESWICLRGKVQVILYDIDDKILRDDIVLYPLDCSITLEGGHNYQSLYDDTIVIEVKTGPYNGQLEDKEFINV